MSVQLVDWKLDMSITLRWILYFCFCAYFLVKAPISSMLTTKFLNMRGYFEMNRRRCWGTSISYWLCSKSFLTKFSSIRRFWIKRCLEKNFSRRWLLTDASVFQKHITTHTPIFQFFGILFAVCDCYAYYLLKCSSDIDINWRRAGFLTKTVVIITSHGSKNFVTMGANSVYTETISFLLLTSSNKILNATIWPNCLETWENHNLERAGFVLAWRDVFGSTVIPPSSIYISRQSLTHWVGTKLTSIVTHNMFAQIR